VRLSAACAACAAASRLFLADAGFDFVEEVAGDSCCMGTGGMERNRDADVDATLEFGTVGNDRPKRLVTEGVADLSEVGLLECSGPFELGHQVAQQLEVRVVVLLDTLDDGLLRGAENVGVVWEGLPAIQAKETYSGVCGGGEFSMGSYGSHLKMTP